MTARLTRLLAAALLLAGGIVHLDLWNGGYRYIPRIGAITTLGFALFLQSHHPARLQPRTTR